MRQCFCSVQDARFIKSLQITYIYKLLDGSFFYTQGYSKNAVTLLLYYLYCLCKFFKDRFFFKLLFFSESGCKGKNF